MILNISSFRQRKTKFLLRNNSFDDFAKISVCKMIEGGERQRISTIRKE
jgi:hypothetical protein